MFDKWAAARAGVGLARRCHHILGSGQRHCTADHRHHAGAADSLAEAAACKRWASCILFLSPYSGCSSVSYCHELCCTPESNLHWDKKQGQSARPRWCIWIKSCFPSWGVLYRSKLLLGGLQKHKTKRSACHHWAGQLPRGHHIWLPGWHYPLSPYALTSKTLEVLLGYGGSHFYVARVCLGLSNAVMMYRHLMGAFRVGYVSRNTT